MAPAGGTAEHIDNVIINNRLCFCGICFSGFHFLLCFLTLRKYLHTGSRSRIYSTAAFISVHNFFYTFMLLFMYLFPSPVFRAVSLRPRRQTSQPESTRTAEDENRVGGGHHPCEVQQHHPDLGRGAAGGEVTHNVLQWQDRKVIWFNQNFYKVLRQTCGGCHGMSELVLWIILGFCHGCHKWSFFCFTAKTDENHLFGLNKHVFFLHSYIWRFLGQGISAAPQNFIKKLICHIKKLQLLLIWILRLAMLRFS